MDLKKQDKLWFRVKVVIVLCVLVALCSWLGEYSHASSSDWFTAGFLLAVIAAVAFVDPLITYYFRSLLWFYRVGRNLIRVATGLTAEQDDDEFEPTDPIQRVIRDESQKAND